MSLTGTDNRNPRDPQAPLTREDVTAIVKDTVDAVRAEIIGEQQAKAKETADAETGGKAMADAARDEGKAKISNIARYKGRFDALADKDPADMTTMERARMFARWLQCSYHARSQGGGLDEMVQHAKDHGQETLVKAMSTSDFDDGGFLMEPAFASGVIEELLARSVYVRAGPQMLDLPDGGLVLPYESDGADAQWGAEGTEVSAEEIKGGQINMQPHKLITVVGVSNDLLRGAPGKSDTFIVNSMLRGMKTKLDATLLRGVGVSNEPNGLSGLMASAHDFAVTLEASLTQAILVQELLYCQTLVETDNIDLATDKPFYFMSPRSKNFLRAQRATDGRLFPEMSDGPSGSLLGAGYDSTSNIPNNVTASYSEIYFVALSHMILGQNEDMLVDVFPGGTYNNSSGTKKSGISADETVVRTIGKWDHAAGQRGNEIARMNTVDWV